jgi:hypothetical protein
MMFALQTKVPGQQLSIDGAVLLRELIAFVAGGLSAPAQLLENTEESK